MKNLVSIFAALILLAACKEGEQAVNRKESLPEGMSEVVFNQVNRSKGTLLCFMGE